MRRKNQAEIDEGLAEVYYAIELQAAFENAVYWAIQVTIPDGDDQWPRWYKRAQLRQAVRRYRLLRA